MRHSALIILLALPVLGTSGPWGGRAHAKVLHSKQGALKLAFPGADGVKSQHFFLTKTQLEQIAARIRGGDSAG